MSAGKLEVKVQMLGGHCCTLQVDPENDTGKSFCRSYCAMNKMEGKEDTLLFWYGAEADPVAHTAPRHICEKAKGKPFFEDGKQDGKCSGKKKTVCTFFPFHLNSWKEKAGDKLRCIPYADKKLKELPHFVGSTLTRVVYGMELFHGSKMKETDAELWRSFGLGTTNYIVYAEALSANNLAAADITGKSDPYVVVWIRRSIDRHGTELPFRDPEARFKTQVKPKTLNPCWTEDPFCLMYPQGVMKDEYEIIFWVMDKDMIGKDDFLGQAVIPYEQLCKARDQGGVFEFQSLPLTTRPSGFGKDKIQPTGDLWVRIRVEKVQS